KKQKSEPGGEVDEPVRHDVEKLRFQHLVEAGQDRNSEREKKRARDLLCGGRDPCEPFAPPRDDGARAESEQEKNARSAKAEHRKPQRRLPYAACLCGE